MAAPLIYSGDITRLDDFTLNVLCNSEVIDVDQDALGRQARIVRENENEFVLAKPMEDGSTAIGLFNLSQKVRRIAVNWQEIGVEGRFLSRDVWRQKDLGPVEGQFASEVPPHGVSFVRLFPIKKSKQNR